MAIKLADAFVEIDGDNNPLKRTLASTKGMISGWLRNTVQGIGQGIGQSLFNTIAQGIQRGMGLIGASLNATRDLNESLSKTVVAFGDSAKTILDWSKTSATALGQSRQQALEAAASFGLLFNSMGLARDESAGMSMTLVQLATDIASINNISIDEALIKLRAGLVGETEPLRTVGVLLNATAVEAEALRTGLADTTEAITEQDKVMARYNLILEQTIATQGDFARTSQGIANQERILAAQRQDALATIGSAFAPIYLVILKNINRILTEISPYGENIVRSLAEGMVNGIIYLLPVLKQIGEVIGYWLKPGSPPRILPHLVRWGADAMNEYLGGFAQADFGVLETLGGTIEGIMRSFVTSGAIAENEIVDRVFGTRQAIASAISQWRTAGQVTEASMRAIQDAAGPVGFSLAGVVRSYFDLEGASRRAAQAQQELADATEHYERLLDPLNDALDDINDKQQAIRDRQATSAARRTLRDPAATANEKRLAQLDIEEIKIRQQMDSVEEERDTALDAAQQKLKAAQKEEEVARSVYAAQQALLDQQILTNRLIGEQNELRKKQGDEAERLYQATLQYNLAISSTEGKLALLRLELGRHSKDSVEYYGILTQIAGLEKQLKDEAETESLISETGILPGLDELGIPQWAEELATRLDEAIKAAFPVSPVIDPNVFLAQGLDTDTSGGINQSPIAVEASEEVKGFVDSIKDLTAAIGDLTPPLQSLADLFGETGDEAEETGVKVTEDAETWLERASKSVKFWTNVMEGDWSTLWDNYVKAAKEDQRTTAEDQVVWLAGLKQGWDDFFTKWREDIKAESAARDIWLEEQKVKIGGWLTSIGTAISTFDLSAAGSAMLESLGTGITTYWDEHIQPWWEEKMQWIADLLPGSEPKDKSSPLAGLQDRGRAIVENLQLGIDSANLTLPGLDAGVTAAAGAGGGKVANFYEGAFKVDANSPQGLANFKQALKEVLEEWNQ